MNTGEGNIDALVDGCRKVSRKAQEQLYKDYYRAMVTLCLRYTKNEADAVEVLNNGFLKVFRNIGKYNCEQAGLYTWIRTIIINSCLDFIKSRQKMELHRELAEGTEVHIPADVVGKMRANELLLLVRELPPATQAVFNLYVLEGYNHKEIAQMLSISVGTSKWHLSEARRSLKLKIQYQDIHE